MGSTYGSARKALSEVVEEAELLLAEKASADHLDDLRRQFDEAAEVHLAKFGFDRTGVES